MTNIFLRITTLSGLLLTALPAWSQEPVPVPAKQPDAATVNTSLTPEGGRIVVEARGLPPKVPVFFTADAVSQAKAETGRMEQQIALNVRILQGEPEVLSLGLFGAGEVYEVTGEGLISWSVRRSGENRFLDLKVTPKAEKTHAFRLKARSVAYRLPSTVELIHLGPGEAVSLTSQLSVRFAENLDHRLVDATGFVPLEIEDNDPDTDHFQTSKGGRLAFEFAANGALPGPVELTSIQLQGAVDTAQQSAAFKLQATAIVTQANAVIPILQGRAALSAAPADPNYRVRLRPDGGYEAVFAQPGTFPVALDFVAATNMDEGWNALHFQVASGAVATVQLTGIGPDMEFREKSSLLPRAADAKDWKGFLPVTGALNLAWKPARAAGEGKLFYTSTANIETTVGAGLMRQETRLEFKVLQGELKDLSLVLNGPGEVLSVNGNDILGWNIRAEGTTRVLDVKLSQPIKETGQLQVRTQTALDSLPVKIQGLRLTPVGTVRHSGYIRLSNQGSVSLATGALAGLTQLSPDQFPAEAPGNARQIFVYRFPSAEYGYEVSADRIQPEVNVSELIVYSLAETDRVIAANVELDIREAAIRDFDFTVPSDYSVVSVSGAAVGDYVLGSEVVDNARTLKVLFNQDVMDRQLVVLRLEKNEAAAAGNWILPKIKYPSAKSVRGDIGIAGAPGFRLTAGTNTLLTEKPLNYFPSGVDNLQQAFRIRERDWTATVKIELLQKAVQADVFHLYSLSERRGYASTLINFFVTGAPVNEWTVSVPPGVVDVKFDGQDIRGTREEGQNHIVSLQRNVIGAYTLLVTYEEKLEDAEATIKPGQVAPVGVQGEQGYIQVVSPTQVTPTVKNRSESLLKLDPLELPAEFRLLSSAPPLDTYQYTERPFTLEMGVAWSSPSRPEPQVVEFSEARTRVSPDGQHVTDLVYHVKSQGQQTLQLELPADTTIWNLNVEGQPAKPRQDKNATLIPLPAGTDPNNPVQVFLRLGKESKGRETKVALPKVGAPVLKTEWSIAGNEDKVLVPHDPSDTVIAPKPKMWQTGFEWIGQRGLGTGFAVIVLLTFGAFLGRFGRWPGLAGILLLAAGITLAAMTAHSAWRQLSGFSSSLELSVPVLAAHQDVNLKVRSLPPAEAGLNLYGVLAILAGTFLMLWPLVRPAQNAHLWKIGGAMLIGMGVLWQHGGAPLFLALVAVTAFGVLLAPLAVRWGQHWRRPAAAVPVLIGLLMFTGLDDSRAQDGYKAADEIVQTWTLKDGQIQGTATLAVTGKAGDRYLLLNSPATLIKFEGAGLRIAPLGESYVVTILPPAEGAATEAKFQAAFDYLLEAKDAAGGIGVPTGPAAVQRLTVKRDTPGWDFVSEQAVQITPSATRDSAVFLLAPRPQAKIAIRPRARDIASEATQFYVEAAQLYLPGPGVIDGRHLFHVRPSQGQVKELALQVPAGLTVSDVTGPASSWQFDAEKGTLKLTIEPALATPFTLLVTTQRGLDPLPAEATLAPLRVTGAAGEVGLIGLAFGPDAQPEKSDSATLAPVNLGDFDASLLPGEEGQKPVLHQVFRYGKEAGEVAVRVAPVAPEVRVASKQSLSLGEERLILSANFEAEITRAGLFQLSFPLPAGLEVESLTGPALHHWTEQTAADGSRQILLHLNGKTLGRQTFALTLSGPAPATPVAAPAPAAPAAPAAAPASWPVPRFELNEATRQTGELLVRSAAGLRLRTSARANVSEVDPRSLGTDAQGTLAYRLLQRDWTLSLVIEKLEPRVNAQVLHEVTVREGQTRSVLFAKINVQNASILSLKVQLPIQNAEEIKTVTATGKLVSDFVATGQNGLWDLQFKRRALGDVDVRIEYERRGDRAGNVETLQPASFPDAGLTSYYFAVRTGGRLGLDPLTLTTGWQAIDWNTVPKALREAGNRRMPALTLRESSADQPLALQVRRHDLADALSLRVADGRLMTVLSPAGEQLTAVDLELEVIQRSPLKVGLPENARLYSIFVNGESVNSVHQQNEYEFNIAPGAGETRAHVRFVYMVMGKDGQLGRLKLISPTLNVPLENIAWSVSPPEGYKLVDDEGDLELKAEDRRPRFTESQYLAQVQTQRQAQSRHAEETMQKANDFIQRGELTNARLAYGSVANQHVQDAALNEDARVQWETVQRAQAVAGINTRRQVLYLDNNTLDESGVATNAQIIQGAANNPILQDGDVDFKPQDLSQLLQGNTTEENAVLQKIAAQLVAHQRAAEPAPQSIAVSLPVEGQVYTFNRAVQVKQNAPLELDLKFKQERETGLGRSLLVWVLLGAIAALLALWPSRRVNP